MDRYGENYLEGHGIGLHHDEQQDRDGHGQVETQNVVDEEELLAAQAAAEEAALQQQQQPGGAFNNVGQGLTGMYRDMMMQYWQETINSIEHDEHDFKNHQLPLARIKKVMKTDEDVRMISAEAPILFAKGCDVFITELTMRAWIHAEENKRRTLQKSDIAAALTKSDMFDFLIDVVPREEEKPKKSYSALSRSSSYANTPSNSNNIIQQNIPQQHPQVPVQQPMSQGIEEGQELKQGNEILHQHMLHQQMIQQNNHSQQQRPPPPPQHMKLEEPYHQMEHPIPDRSNPNSLPSVNNQNTFQSFNFPVYE